MSVPYRKFLIFVPINENIYIVMKTKWNLDTLLVAFYFSFYLKNQTSIKKIKNKFKKLKRLLT